MRSLQLHPKLMPAAASGPVCELPCFFLGLDSNLFGCAFNSSPNFSFCHFSGYIYLPFFPLSVSIFALARSIILSFSFHVLSFSYDGSSFSYDVSSFSFHVPSFPFHVSSFSFHVFAVSFSF